MSLEIGNLGESFVTTWMLTFIRSLSSMNSEMLLERVVLFEGLSATFLRALVVHFQAKFLLSDLEFSLFLN